jgi:hypothetical protein
VKMLVVVEVSTDPILNDMLLLEVMVVIMV